MRKRIATTAGLLAASLLVLAPATAAETTITASADTYVKDGASSNQNYGDALEIRARNPEIQTHKGLIRFDGIPAGVTSATLRLYVVDHSPEAGKVREVASPWAEYGTTWKTRPDLGPLVGVIPGGAQVGEWKTLDVTSAIDGPSLGLYIIGTHRNAVEYASRESSNPPELVVITTGATTTTTTPPGGAETVVAAGDIASCSYTRDTDTAELVLDEFATDPSATVLPLGDLVYPDGTPAQFDDCYHPTWGQFKSRTKPVPGNHDWNTANAAGYRGYWGYTAGESLNSAYNRGEWRLIGIDSEAYKDASSNGRASIEQWLETQIGNAPGECVLVYTHHPRFSAGQHGDKGWLSDLWDIAHDSGKVRLWLSGHDHNYERRRPENKNGGNDPDGIRQFIAGFGGTNLRDASPDSGTQVLDDSRWGVLVLELTAGGYAWRAEATDGSTIDTGSEGLDC